MPHDSGRSPAPENLLLRGLPERELSRLRPHLRKYSTNVGEELHCRREDDPDVFFPVESVSSLVVEGSEGVAVEVASVGAEGMVGLPIFVESDAVVFNALTQVPGEGLRMPRKILTRELEAKETFAERLEEYTEVLLLAVGQSSFCATSHSIPRRCARWLLAISDRAPGREVAVTHEFLAQLLGARRATITQAMNDLVRRKLVRNRRGALEVLDRKGLEAVACGCYHVIRSEFATLLSKWKAGG